MNWLQCNYNLQLNPDSKTEPTSVSFQKNLLFMVPNYEVSIDPYVTITQSENFDFSDFGWCWCRKNKLPEFTVRASFIDPFTDESIEVQGLCARIYLAKCGWESNAPMLKNVGLEGESYVEFKKDTALFKNLRPIEKIEAANFQANLIITIQVMFRENDTVKTGILASFMSNPIWMVNTPLRCDMMRRKVFEEMIGEKEQYRLPPEPRKQRGLSLNLNTLKAEKMISQKSVYQKMTSLKKITTLTSPKRNKTLISVNHAKSGWNLGSPKKAWQKD